MYDLKSAISWEATHSPDSRGQSQPLKIPKFKGHPLKLHKDRTGQFQSIKTANVTVTFSQFDLLIQGLGREGRSQ